MTQSSSLCASRMALILGHIYEAALDFNKWRHALAEIREILRANNVILILRPGTARSPGLSLVFREDLYEYADPFANSAAAATPRPPTCHRRRPARSASAPTLLIW